MPAQLSPQSEQVKKPSEGSLLEKLEHLSEELGMRYAIPTFDGKERRPTTGWMVVDIAACSTASPFGSITRTFQARELINDSVSVTLPVLRAQSFFTEVRKLLVFTARVGTGRSVWDDQVLNKRALRVQNLKVVALVDGPTIWDGKQVLEEKEVVGLFERATALGRERMTFHVEWHESSLSQGTSLGRV